MLDYFQFEDQKSFYEKYHSQATKITADWIKTAVDKSIETTGSRTRLNIIGSIRLGYLSDTIVEYLIGRVIIVQSGLLKKPKN